MTDGSGPLEELQGQDEAAFRGPNQRFPASAAGFCTGFYMNLIVLKVALGWRMAGLFSAREAKNNVDLLSITKPDLVLCLGRPICKP